MKLTLIIAAGTIAIALPAAAMADGGATQFVSNPVVEALPSADTAPLPATMPVCKAGQQNACINRYAATGKGTRPLHYWPGKPASSAPGNADH